MPGWPAVVACLAGMAGAWIAAGSTGLMAPTLRHALGWLALATAALAAWPRTRQSWPERLTLAVAVAAAIGLTVPAASLYNVLAVVILLAVFARSADGVDRTVLGITAFAVFAFAVWRLAYESIPTVWLTADAMGSALGRVAAAASGEPLWVGATFAGLDFLVLMAGLVFGWLVSTAPPRIGRAVYAVVGILAGHFLYLLILAWSNQLAAALPAVAPAPPSGDFYTPPDWQWTSALRSMLPWNVPLVAAAIHLLAAAIMLRWARWSPAIGQAAPQVHKPSDALLTIETPSRYVVLILALAVALPLLTTYCTGKVDLAGRKIVANEQGHLDWVKPTHDRYGQSSVGMYGMLPELIASLGGTFARSAKMTEADLADADLLVVFHPLAAWPEEQTKRVWDFVRGGGSLLVVTGPRVRDDETPTCVNRLLEPTGMEVRFDIAMSATAYWQHACQTLAHPTTTGLGDARCDFGLAMGPSVYVRWPARPILAGRWGWSDPGSDALTTGRYRYDTGERLGDLVLAAEQQVGQGRVMVLADHTCLSNEALPQSYRFAGRLLGYLAQHAATPQVVWRQVLALATCLGLLVLAGWRLDASLLAAATAAIALSLVYSSNASDAAWQVTPQSASAGATRIAYIDATHSEAFVDSRWQGDGIVGLSLMLMRNGYLPLMLPEFSPQRLEQAAMLISIGPSRAFSASEQTTVREFVERGGIFVCMAGADRARAVNPLLAPFGFHIPVSPIPAGENGAEPIPMSSVRGPYVPDGQSKAEVSFHAVWPIENSGDNVQFLLNGPGNKPIIVARGIGRGKFLVIGDTAFALNKNLETTEGAHLAWPAKNVNFWRWFLTHLSGQSPWIPPDPKPEEKPKEDTTSTDDSAAGGAPMQESEEANR